MNNYHNPLSGDQNIDLTECPCNYCEEIIKNDDCTECHDCGGWVHKKCSGLSERKFELLCLSQDDDSVRWVCKECVNGETEKQGVLAKKIDKMYLMIQNLSKELTAIKTNQKESGEKLEEKINKIVEQKLKEKLDQVDEKEKREKNIIIFNIPESSQTGEQEKAEDLRRAREIIMGHCPTIQESDMIEPIRLGKTKPTDPRRPRPLRLKASSVKAKWEVIKSWKTYNTGREAEERIYINPDLSKEERQTQKALRDQLKARISAGETNLMIRGDKIVERPTQATTLAQMPALENASRD